MTLPKLKGEGYIIGDVELRFTKSGKAVANFPVAFSKSKKNEQTGQWERTHNLVVRATAWEKQAEDIADMLGKGENIEVEGPVYMTEWEGKTRVEMLVDSFMRVGQKQKQEPWDV